MWDDTGYELSDPKHPSYYERYADAADIARKRAKEEPPAPRPEWTPDPRVHEDWFGDDA